MVSKAVAPLFNTDAYKLDHRRQYPTGTELVFSNWTDRGSRIPEITETVHFGLQAFLVDLTEAFEPFFAGDIDEIVEEYTNRVNSILGPNEIGAEHIRALHDYGRLPVEFAAVPEGTKVPLRVPRFTINNTHPDFFWVVNYLETWISASVWQPSTSATLADRFHSLLEKGAVDTDYANSDSVQFQGHDFSFRGMAGVAGASASAAGHLLSFQGSDTLSALGWVDSHYGDNPGQDYSGWLLGSVPATEHSVMCAGGQDDELDTYRRLIELYPSGIASVVSDTWDLWNVLTNILPQLHDEIMARDGKIVIRPDSGDPVDIIAGTQDEEWANGSGYEKIKVDRKFGQATTPAEKGVIELLWDEFGGTVNDQGYKVLDPHVGAIYGDSITYDRAQQIISRLGAKGFASTNIVFGVGSYTYQYQTRDTFGSAIKATYVQIDGEGKAISKNPVTDNGLKKSATGLLVVIRNEETGVLELFDDLDKYEYISVQNAGLDELKTIWYEGDWIYWQSFDEVREVLKNGR